ncbi:hypothetical protein [Microbacterium sp. NPDC080220]|uniref:hypothetical protein n=1 Tax=Microbacterium sp. NPDC080220 TaxID=3161017 RepID=UPI003412BCBB
MIVLGFDTSLTVSGCARVDLGVGESGQVEALHWETWRARASRPTDDSVLGERRRIRQMLREILALVPERFDLAVIEGPAPGGKFSGKADERSGLRWMLIDQLCARGEVVKIDPQTRAVLGSGRGVRRRKNETAAQAKAFVLNAVRLLVPDANVPDHNVGDAVALAHAGAVALGLRAEYSAAQTEAHAKVAWPVMEGIPA